MLRHKLNLRSTTSAYYAYGGFEQTSENEFAYNKMIV